MTTTPVIMNSELQERTARSLDDLTLSELLTVAAQLEGDELLLEEAGDPCLRALRRHRAAIESALKEREHAAAAAHTKCPSERHLTKEADDDRIPVLAGMDA